MNQSFGPFSVDPAQVAGLGGALFQELVGRLLAAEVASADLAGSDLHTSYRDNFADGGVDAGVYAATPTTWIPIGNSAWQFKAGDLPPGKCAAELEGARRAREILEDNGKYRLVLGKPLEEDLIASRERKLRAKAAELGYDNSGDNFKIIDGNQLARWVEQYPQLAVSPVLRGIGNVAINFDSWQQSKMHQSAWVPSRERDELQSTVRAFLSESNRSELRIEGVSGLGKTRGVLESLRGSGREFLVLYVGDADDLNYPLIAHLVTQKRRAVLVIDECTRKRHNVFAQQLTTGAQIKLITIGEQDSRVLEAAPIVLAALPTDVIETILTHNKPTLWVEARRVVATNCAGNVRWAMRLADAILENPKINVTSLIDANSLELVVGDLLSAGDDFLAFSALALFSRYGVDQELLAQLERIASGLGIALEDLLNASLKLERLGFVTKHGRYRSITPQPLAAYLATQAWNALGDKIIADLLPTLDEELAEQLFLRAADLGSSGPAAVALNQILSPNGPFRSFEAIQERGASRLLTQLAIISPDGVAGHLKVLMESASEEQLRDIKSIRRDLVWTLEKLVWHSTTFQQSADMLLRLAVAENETWSNNATGTWISLFSPIIPATAAAPSVRMSYLVSVAADPNPAVRKLVAHAADSVIDSRGGWVMVSGELQGGVVVEPRGTPETYADLWDYVRAGFGLLRTLVDDTDSGVHEIAEKALVAAIHSMLDNVAVRDTFFGTIADLPDESLRKVRTEVKHLYALFANVEKPSFRAAMDKEPDVAARRTGLDILSARLPPAKPIDELMSLAYARRWDWEDGELQAAIERVALSMSATDVVGGFLELLGATPAPDASFELGGALHTVAAGERVVESLANLADRGNIAGLVGYLHASIADGNGDAFDVFLDGPTGTALKPVDRLAVTVRGPQSAAGWSRLVNLLKVLPVDIGARGMFGWHVRVDEPRIVAIIDEWQTRIESQADYNAAVDIVAMMVFQRSELSLDVETRIAKLVELRSMYPEVGQQDWDWAQLARRQLAYDVDRVLFNMLREVDAGTLHIFEGSEERQLVRDAIVTAGKRSLDDVLEFIQVGSWRLRMDLRGWLADVYSAADVITWVGQDVERAQLVASLTNIPEGQPSELVCFLLGDFGTDDKVSSALYGEFVSGFWSGNESSRLTGQISQLNSWIAERDVPMGVKVWANDVLSDLKKRLTVVLQEEAEESG